MGDYKKRPEPERHVEKVVQVEKVVEKESENNVEALAEAVALALKKNLNLNDIVKSAQYGNVGGNNVGSKVDEGFDNSRSLDKLAKSMIVQRGKNEANFENLGNVEETEKDKAELKRAIDLLSNLD